MKFQMQQIGATAAIIAVWLLVICYFSAPVSRPQPQPATSTVVREKVEPRSEKSGEIARVHRFDEAGQPTETEVRFRDGAVGTIHMSFLGRPSKIVERTPQGNYQVFVFSRDGQGIVSIKSYRKDNTLVSETSAGEGDSIRVKRYATDGKSLVSDELVGKDGSFQSTVFEPGKFTPRYVYKSTAGGAASELVVYGPGGLVERRETLLRNPLQAGGFGMFGHMMMVQTSTITVTTMAADGTTVRTKQIWTANSMSGAAALVEASELDAQGNLVRRLSPASKDKTPVSFKLESFGDKASTKLLAGDLSIVDAEGKKGSSKEDCGDLAVQPLSVNLTSVLPVSGPSPEPNHLQQMLSQ